MSSSALVIFAVAVSAASGLLESSQSSLHFEEPPYKAWSPPPEYASKTWGHKTMYLADVTIGPARQTFRMLIDTGSWLVVVPGAACKHLGCSGHRRFDTSNSTSGNQTASINFAQGAVAGHVFSDTVCAGPRSTHLQEVGFLQRKVADDISGAASSTCAQMSFLVAEHESVNFANAPFDGILGLGLQGRPDRGMGKAGDHFSFLKQLSAQGRVPDSVFTLQLGNQGESQLTFGSVDENTLVGGQFLWVPLSAQADGHWQISVADLTLNGVSQSMGDMEVIVDSGTSLLAPDEGLSSFLKARLTPSDCSNVNALPKLGLRLRGGGVLTMLPSDYIDRVEGKCELAVMPMNISAAAAAAAHSVPPRLILGDSFLRRFTTVFDLRKRRLGFGVATGGDESKELAEALFPGSTSESLDAATLVAAKAEEQTEVAEASPPAKMESPPAPKADEHTQVAEESPPAKTQSPPAPKADEHTEVAVESQSAEMESPPAPKAEEHTDVAVESPPADLESPPPPKSEESPTVKMESPPEKMPSLGGLLGHLTVGRMLRVQRDAAEAKTADDGVADATMNAQEQAGFDFINHLWDPSASASDAQGQNLLRRMDVHRAKARTPVIHTTEDKLKVAGDNLDKILSQLKAKKASEQQKADKAYMDSSRKIIEGFKKQAKDTKASANSLSWWTGVTAAADKDVKHLQDEAAEKQKTNETNKKLKQQKKHPAKAAKKAIGDSIKWWANTEPEHIRRHVGISPVSPDAKADADKDTKHSIDWWASAKAQHIRDHVGIASVPAAVAADVKHSIGWWASAKAQHIRDHVGITSDAAVDARQVESDFARWAQAKAEHVQSDSTSAEEDATADGESSDDALTDKEEQQEKRAQEEEEEMASWSAENEAPSADQEEVAATTSEADMPAAHLEAHDAAAEKVQAVMPPAVQKLVVVVGKDAAKKQNVRLLPVVPKQAVVPPVQEEAAVVVNNSQDKKDKVVAPSPQNLVVVIGKQADKAGNDASPVRRKVWPLVAVAGKKADIKKAQELHPVAQKMVSVVGKMVEGSWPKDTLALSSDSTDDLEKDLEKEEADEQASLATSISIDMGLAK